MKNIPTVEQGSKNYANGSDLGADFGIDGGDVLHQVNNTTRVSVFVIVPGNKLDE